VKSIVSSCCEVVSGLGRFEGGESRAVCRRETFYGGDCCLAQHRLELGECIFEWVEVGATGLSHNLTKLAQLGGYLTRACDLPPRNVVIGRGLSRLTAIQIGVKIGAGDVGN